MEPVRREYRIWIRALRVGGEVEQGGIKKCYSDVYHHSASHQDRASCTRQGRGAGGKVATHACHRCKMLRPTLLSLLELAYRGDARVACLIARGADVNQTGDDAVGGTVAPCLWPPTRATVK